jgi:monoamine oxidase
MALTRRQALAGLGASGVAACAPDARAPARGAARTDADVIVIGAGLSGLHAARILERDGAKVTVLEATDRIGGRMWTRDDLPWRPEAGGQQVGQTYARIRAECAALGLPLETPPPPLTRARTYIVGDTVVHSGDWETSDLNPFAGPFRAMAPDRVLFAAAAPENPFDTPLDWRETGPNVDVDAAYWLESRGFSPAALRLIDVALNANTLRTYSMINLWRTLEIFSRDRDVGPSQEVVGGSQRLPEAMAESLVDVRTGHRVSAIRDGFDRPATVMTDRGNLRADFVIVAVPFPVLRDIDIEVPLQPATVEAIRELPYTQIRQVHLELESAASPDGLPLGMWTDGPLERLFPINRDGETVALTAWINGDRVDPRRGDDALMAEAEDWLMKARGLRARARGVTNWHRGMWAGGAYMHWAPLQVGAMAGSMGAPIGRLHFAGEHLSHLHTGMEGAMESGERAAYAVMMAIDPS